MLIKPTHNTLHYMGGSRTFRRGGGGGGTFLFVVNHQRISKKAVRTSLEKQSDPRVPIAS